ncbi:MAG: substrate-binding domain-containing protein [Desulfovibrio sp.]|jgi:rhamnose transport system substrate-binding protein|nr:substrate-binding domain-containing protein [Desulfovibrio sp.]
MKKNIFVMTTFIAALAGLFAVFFSFGWKTPDTRIVETVRVPAESKKITIYFIPKNLNNPYFEAMSTGLFEAISELGEEHFRYVYIGPQIAEPENQIEFVKRAIQDKADAVFIASNSNTALNDVFDEARKGGTRIISINQDIPGSESHRDAAIIPADFKIIPNAQLDLMGEQIGYDGQFAIVSATEDAPDQSSWVNRMQREVKENPKYARMKLVEVVYGDDQVDRSMAVTKDLLSKYPRLEGILSPTTVGVAAACRAVRESGMSGKVKVTGFGLPSEMAEFVLDGTCESFQLWDPHYLGYLGVYMVWAEAREGFSIVPGATFRARKLGRYTIQPNGQIVSQPIMRYDRANIMKYAAQF